MVLHGHLGLVPRVLIEVYPYHPQDSIKVHVFMAVLSGDQSTMEIIGHLFLLVAQLGIGKVFPYHLLVNISQQQQARIISLTHTTLAPRGTTTVAQALRGKILGLVYLYHQMVDTKARLIVLRTVISIFHQTLVRLGRVKNRVETGVVSLYHQAVNTKLRQFLTVNYTYHLTLEIIGQPQDRIKYGVTQNYLYPLQDSIKVLSPTRRMVLFGSPATTAIPGIRMPPTK